MNLFESHFVIFCSITTRLFLDVAAEITLKNTMKRLDQKKQVAKVFIIEEIVNLSCDRISQKLFPVIYVNWTNFEELKLNIQM